MYQGKFSNKSGGRRSSEREWIEPAAFEKKTESRENTSRSAETAAPVDFSRPVDYSRPADLSRQQTGHAERRQAYEQRPVNHQRTAQPADPRQPASRPVASREPSARPADPRRTPQRAADPRQPARRPQQPAKQPAPQQSWNETEEQQSQQTWSQVPNQNASLQFDLKFDDPSNKLLTPDFNEGYEEYDPPLWGQPEEQPKKRRTGVIIGGIVFYVLLALGIGFFMLKTNMDLKSLDGQLSDFEKLQPTYLSQKTFEQLFTDPDWAAIYDNSGSEISQFEGKAAYAAFMENKVGETELTYRRVSGDQKTEVTYGVYLGSEQVAGFTLKNDSTDWEHPNWDFGGVEIFYETQQAFKIQAREDHVVKINDVPMKDGYLIKRNGTEILDTLGEKGKGVELPAMCVYEVTDFLVKPQVTIEDAEGKALTVSYDEETRTFSEPADQTAVPEEAKELGLNAVRTYCEFMIKKAYRNELNKYFKPNTDTYKYITASDLTWIQREKGHGFADEQVSDYIRLDENTFAIRVSLTWQLTRQDDTIKESPVDMSLIFEKDNNGKWLCTRMTGVEFTKPAGTVRVRFFQNDELVSSVLVDSEAKTIACPAIEVPSNRKMDGWVTRMTDAEGNDYYQRVFLPDADGNSPVPEGLLDEPIDLRPVYQIAK